MNRILAPSLFALALVAAAPEPAAAQSCSSPYFVEQAFPTTGSAQTTWRVCWQALPGWGVVITSAFFKKAPTAPWIRLFWDARVSEIFVPYHPGSPRYYDFMVYNFGLHNLTTTDCPAPDGTLLGAPSKICKEVRQRGLAWKDNLGVYRGEELVLWGAVAAANYIYIIEWTFRDDGVVLGRFGATGTNLPSEPYTVHMHNAMWRLDIDLNGFWGDAVHQGVHTENLATGAAVDTDPIVPTERFLDWDDRAFTELHVHDSALKNAHSHATSYHLMPIRSGSSRHQEDWTRHDFWITKYKWTEMRPNVLPSYVAPAENVSSADVVVWYWGSVHHTPRDEDGILSDYSFSGVAQLMWTGFMIKPHHLFDAPPLWKER